MPSWVAGVVGTFALSLVSAYGFLQLRYRKAGRPFGPHAKWWAAAVIVITAAVSTGLGVAAVAASHHVRAVYVGLILPSGLWLGESFNERARQRGSLVPKQLIARLTLPLRRLNDGMGDDMQDWCDARLRVVWQKPQRISDAAHYYYSQVAGRLKDVQAREELIRWRESIAHKVKIVLLIDREPTPARLHVALQSHPSTRNVRKYAPDDLPLLARRLEKEAESEFGLFLASLYRLGHRKLLIYPFRTSDRT